MSRFESSTSLTIYRDVWLSLYIFLHLIVSYVRKCADCRLSCFYYSRFRLQRLTSYLFEAALFVTGRFSQRLDKKLYQFETAISIGWCAMQSRQELFSSSLFYVDFTNGFPQGAHLLCFIKSEIK